ncbi:MAG TPA: filamentous hemagglutinin N-terminal domain-containing protein [Opitutaceae bacterium]|jgi:filamentous hemagglutinin family protein
MTTTKNQRSIGQPWKKALLLASVACSLTIPAWGNTPVTTSNNLLMVNGTATTTGGGTNNLTITTTTNNVVLSWSNFWDGTANGGTSTANDQITYTLPSATSSILNQVTGSGLTTINGKISSNGNVYLINPNGVTVGSTGVINAAGFYVSTWLEPLSNFETNGTLAIFGSGWQSLTTNLSGTITVAPNASIQTIGGSGTIGLAANDVEISSNLLGNALLVSGGTVNPTINIGSDGPATIAGNLVVWGGGGEANIGAGGSGAVQVQGSTLIVAGTATNVDIGDNAGAVFEGAVSVNSGGGWVDFGDAGNVLAQGNVTVDSGTNAISMSGEGTTTVQGSLTLTSAATSGTGIWLTDGNTVTVDGSTTVNSGASNVVQDGGMFTANLLGTTATFTTTTGNVNLTNADIASVSANSTSGNFSLTDPTSDPVNLATSNLGTGNFGVSASFITSSGTVTAGNFSATQSTGNLVAPAATVTGAYNLNATNGGISGGSNVTGATYALSGNTSSGSVNFSTTGNATYTALMGSSVNVSASGNVTLAPSSATALNAPSLTITSTGGNITDAGSTSALTLNHTDAFSASGSISLGTTAQADDIASAAVTAGSGGFTLLNGSNGFALGASNISGPAAITASTLALGVTSGDAINIGGALGFTGTGNVSTVANTVTVGGNVTITDSGASSIALGTTGGTDSFGTISVPSGSSAVTVQESTGVSLGAISSGSLSVGSGGNITNASGAIATGGLALYAAGTGTIQLGTTTTPLVASGEVAINNGASAALIMGDAAQVQIGNALGSLWVSTTGANATTVIFAGTGSLGQFAFSGGTGNVSLASDSAPVTVWNAVDSGAAAVSITDSKAITLGSGINLAGTGGATFTSTGTGGISDTANSPVVVFGPVSFTSGGSINVSNNTSNSLGAVSFDLTGGSNVGNLTYAEGQTANIAGVTIANAGYTGTVSISSWNGNVIESGGLTVPSTTTAVNFGAPHGTITLTGANVIPSAVPIGLNASGAIALDNGGSTTLGNVSGGSTLWVSTTAASAGAITQATGSSISVYGNPTFLTDGGAVTLNNAGNNYGAITVDTTNGTAAGATVMITEAATDHYHGINTGTAGNFWATASSGDIIEDAGAVVTIGGTTNLKATNGNVNFNGDNNNLGGALWFWSAGNTTVDDVNTTTLIAATTSTPATVGGTLSITDAGTGSLITDAGTGSFNVTGTSSFTAGSVSLTSAHGSYAGGVAFNTPGAVTFSQAGNILLDASNVNGAASLTSTAGTFNTTGTSNFGSTLSITTLGSLSFGSPVNVAGQLTVHSTNGPINLSADSLTGNLNNITPDNTSSNTVSYTAPSP